MYGCFPYIATMLQQAGETRASIAGVVIAGFGIGGALYGVYSFARCCLGSASSA